MQLEMLNQNVGTFALNRCESLFKHIAIDLGSTQTRTLNFDLDFNEGDVVAIDSAYSEVVHGIQHISSPDDKIFSNLEAILCDKTFNRKKDGAFEKIHIVKGPLFEVLNQMSKATTSDASKINQETTYVNAVFNIALQILLTSLAEGQLPYNTRVDATFALPPEDTVVPIRMKSFKEKMAGTYEVEFPRIGFTVQFTLDESNIYITAEPNAVALTYGAESDHEADVHEVIGFIDVGGRSTGNSFVAGGRLLEDGCYAEPHGGEFVCENIAKNIANRINCNMPRIDKVKKSLSRGILVMGSKHISIAQDIDAAKDVMAGVILTGFTKAITANHLQAQEISRVVCTGRTFGESVNDGAVVSSSLMHKVAALFANRSNFTEFELFESNNPIVRGLMYYRSTKA